MSTIVPINADTSTLFLPEQGAVPAYVHELGRRAGYRHVTDGYHTALRRELKVRNEFLSLDELAVLVAEHLDAVARGQMRDTEVLLRFVPNSEDTGIPNSARLEPISNVRLAAAIALFTAYFTAYEITVPVTTAIRVVFAPDLAPAARRVSVEDLNAAGGDALRLSGHVMY